MNKAEYKQKRLQIMFQQTELQREHCQDCIKTVEARRTLNNAKVEKVCRECDIGGKFKNLGEQLDTLIKQKPTT